MGSLFLDVLHRIDWPQTGVKMRNAVILVIDGHSHKARSQISSRICAFSDHSTTNRKDFGLSTLHFHKQGCQCGTTFCGKPVYVRSTCAMPQRGQDRSPKEAEGEYMSLYSVRNYLLGFRSRDLRQISEGNILVQKNVDFRSSAD